MPEPTAPPPPRLLAACLALIALIGCVETRVVNDPWGDLPIDRASQTRGSGPSDRRARVDPALMQDVWTALVAEYDAERNQQQALRLMRQLQSQPGVPPLWTHQHNDALAVYAGRFADPLSDRAQQQLAAIRAVEIDGKKPFGGVKFVNFASRAGNASDRGGGQSPGDQPLAEHDLKQFIGMYTLQVGFYDDSAGEGFREAAEEAVAKLREDGEEAYYYHGPNRSLICIGLFTEDDLSNQGGITVYSRAIKELQERFPYNMANGRTLIERRGDVQREQPSFVVQIH